MIIINILTEIFNDTIKNGSVYVGNLKNIPCSELMEIATDNKKNYRYGINNLCMFKYDYHGENSVIMIFAIPMESVDNNRPINERFFDILENVEETFVTLNYRQLKEFIEEKYMYFICIKSIMEMEEDNI